MTAPYRWMRVAAVFALLAFVATAPSRALADKGIVKDAQNTIETFKKADPSLSKFFETAAGWVVFPTVGKGGLGVGGAGGSGVLFERGEPVGKATLVQVTVGLQAGGQAYSELVFLETPAALGDFKKSQLTIAAQLSAVAAAAGASANAKYERGVAVFTLAKTGLMYEASVGGQKFEYKPFTSDANKG